MAACFHPPLRDGSLNSKAENGVASYPMVITVDNYDGTLMTGSYVDYSLVASENDNCLVLPIQCVKSVPLEDGSNGNVVFVKGDRPDNAIELSVEVAGVPEGFWPVQVEIGLSDDYNVEIKSGVEEGMEVFTTVQTERYMVFLISSGFTFLKNSASMSVISRRLLVFSNLSNTSARSPNCIIPSPEDQ